MFVSNQSVTWTQAVIDAILGAMLVAPLAELLDAPEIHLYDVAHTANPVTDTPASFTEATFDGYAAAALTLGATEVNFNGVGRLSHGQVDFTMTDTAGGTPNIHGWYMTDGAGTLLYAQGAFSSPIPLQAAGDQISFDCSAIFRFTQ